MKEGNPWRVATSKFIGMADQQHITLHSIGEKVNHCTLIRLWGAASGLWVDYLGQAQEIIDL